MFSYIRTCFPSFCWYKINKIIKISNLLFRSCQNYAIVFGNIRIFRNAIFSILKALEICWRRKYSLPKYFLFHFQFDKSGNCRKLVLYCIWLCETRITKLYLRTCRYIPRVQIKRLLHFLYCLLNILYNFK